jgi:osmoprotectant transport system permease protein
VRVILLSALVACAPSDPVAIGSKKFTESVVLGEIACQLLADAGIRAEHERELGGSRILWNALLAGEIDAYPEYTGTIREELLPGAGDDLAPALAAKGIEMSAPLGFDDSYAIGMKEEVAARLGIRTLSDLAAHPEVVLGLSHEFMDREDGWPALRESYRFTHKTEGLDHDVAYRALDSGSIGATDLYSTDAEIRHYRLRVLEDDRRHFPSYRAVLLRRSDLDLAAVRALAKLEGRISGEQMIAMNARATLDKVTERRVAEEFLASTMSIRATGHDVGLAERLVVRTREHLVLVSISLLLAILFMVPLGVVAAKRPVIGQILLAIVGTLQTIPSLALLVLMIPLLGIGAVPAVTAMFLYSLLPIARNTVAGLTDIPPSLRASAEALGLPPGAQLRLIELPLASRSILAGIKTSAVLNVGTATLGALIGAGGYGQPILTGIRLDDASQILEGAIPAAVLALLVQGFFELIERWAVPRGLRLRPQTEHGA